MKRVAWGLLLLMIMVDKVEAQQWLQARSAHYTIFYEAGYEDDVELAKTWLNLAEALMRDKYAVTLNAYQIAVYLYPAPNGTAGVGAALLQCCTGSGTKTGTIHYLAPSAVAWKEAKEQTTSLGTPYNNDYHAKVMMSEYITVGHYAVQDARKASDGWSYYNAPPWFVQGLQEFDGIFHTTDGNRNETTKKLLEWAGNNRTKFICCSTLVPDTRAIGILDVYNGGAIFMAFLASQFGEDIHARLLRSTAKTFDEAFAHEIQPHQLPDVFELFRKWFNPDLTAQGLASALDFKRR